LKELDDLVEMLATLNPNETTVATATVAVEATTNSNSTEVIETQKSKKKNANKKKKPAVKAQGSYIMNLRNVIALITTFINK